MKTMLCLLCLGLSLSGQALAQVTCSGTGQTLTCIGPNGVPTIQQQLNPNTGVVIAPDGNVTPYTILTPTPAPVLIVPAIPAAPALVMPTPSASGY